MAAMETVLLKGGPHDGQTRNLVVPTRAISIPVEPFGPGMSFEVYERCSSIRKDGTRETIFEFQGFNVPVFEE